MISAEEFFSEAKEDLEEDDLLKNRPHNGHESVDEDETITDEDFFAPVD